MLSFHRWRSMMHLFVSSPSLKSLDKPPPKHPIWRKPERIAHTCHILRSVSFCPGVRDESPARSLRAVIKSRRKSNLESMWKRGRVRARAWAKTKDKGKKREAFDFKCCHPAPSSTCCLHYFMRVQMFGQVSFPECAECLWNDVAHPEPR